MNRPENSRKSSGAGGTPGGIGEFLIGLGMSVGAAYMLTDSVTVASGYWRFFGRDASGLSLVPFIFGMALVFFNGKSVVGWLLLAAGLIIVLSGILLNLHFYFRPTSLFNTIVMLTLLAGGIGLIAKSLRAH